MRTHFGERYSRLEGAVQSKILRTPLKYVLKFNVYDAQVEGDHYAISVGGYVNEKLIEEDVALVGSAVGKETQSRVLIMIAEKYVKDPVFRYWWNEGKALSLETSVNESVFEVHSIFYNVLLKSGYDVINITDAANQHQIPPAFQTLDLSAPVLSQMGELYGVDYILYGKAFEETTLDKKVKTSIQLAFYSQNLKKDILATTDSYNVELMQDLINGVADNFMKKLGKSFLTKSFSSEGIVVIVKHGSNFRKFKEIKEILEHVSGRVSIKSTKQGETVFILKTAKSFSELKESLKVQIRPPAAHILERDERKLEIEIANDIT